MNQEDLPREGWLQEYKWPISIVIGGMLLIGIGVFVYKGGLGESDGIEVVNSESMVKKFVWVDVAGEVNYPNVYKLEDGVRIDEVLKTAGGLTVTADKDWINKNINKAARVTDGQKIYIPKIQQINTNVNSSKISINEASLHELESLQGVGPATAKKITENRPYTELYELVTRKILSEKVYQGLLEEVTLW